MATIRTTPVESNVNVNTNSSVLTLNIYFSADNYQTYFSDTPLYCTCNGQTQSANVSHPVGGSVSVAFSFTIPHNNDGSKTVSWNWSCATETYVLGTVTDSGTTTLTTINRTTTNSVTGTDIDGNFSVNYTKMTTGNYTYKLRISLPNIAALETINYNTSDEVFTLSQETIENLYSRYTTTNTFNLGFAVETWSSDGQTRISSGNEVVIQARITGANPVFTDFDFEDINTDVVALTGNNQINVNGYSNIKITIPNVDKAIAQKGATMRKYRIVVGGQTIDIDSADMYKCSKSNTVLCTLSGRKYYKTTDDEAFVGYYYSSEGFTGPILVGTTADSVKYTTEGQTFSGTQITYEGNTYYVSSNQYFWTGNQTSTEGVATKLSNSAITQQQANETMLNKLISESSDLIRTINNSTSGIYEIYAIDSRNNSTLVTKFADSVKQYTPLVRNTNYSVERDDGGIGGNVTLSFSGTIWNDSFGLVANGFRTAKYLFKKTDSSQWIDLGSSMTNITPTLNGNNFSFTGLIRSNNADTTWDLDSSYDIKVILEDELSSVEFETVLSSAIPNISLSKNGVGIMCDYDETLGGLVQVGGKVLDWSKIAVAEVYNATRRVYNSTGDVNNVINVSSVNGTVLCYFITRAWPQENWNNGAMVEIGDMFPQTNKVYLKSTSTQNYWLQISALYISN